MMTLLEAIKARHSVRQYTDRPIEAEKAAILREEIDRIEAEYGLSVSLVLREPKAFSGPMAHYGSFRGCENYFVLAGPPKADEAVGYGGERLVLLAQQLGLNTCWAAMTYSKGKIPVKIPAGQKLYIVIALGYGATQGVPHQSKPMEKLCRTEGEMPQWFRCAMEAAMSAPTAVNQQKFRFDLLENDTVEARAFFGPCSAIDLGIAKYHFTIGAEGYPFRWA